MKDINTPEARMPPPAVPLPQHTLLPRKVQEHLKQAAALNDGVPIGESSFRTQAIESAIFHARANHPKLFRIKP